MEHQIAWYKMEKISYLTPEIMLLSYLTPKLKFFPICPSLEFFFPIWHNVVWLLTRDQYNIQERRLTVIWLKLLLTDVRTISLQTSLLTWASVVKTCNRKNGHQSLLHASIEGGRNRGWEHTPSIVAIFGWIIPEPLAIPPILIATPPI